MSFAREHGDIQMDRGTLDNYADGVRAWICIEVGKRTLTNGDISSFVHEQYADLNKAERDYVVNKAKFPNEA